MFFGITYITLRVFQIITLVPIVGMLGYFVGKYADANLLTPDPILILFIISVLALAWTTATLFSYDRVKRNARFIALIDFLFFGALIAAIYFLRGVTDTDCTSLTEGDGFTANVGDFTISGDTFRFSTDKPCAMVKASFAFAIINDILFFFTALAALAHGDDHDFEGKYRNRGRHSHHHYRHGHRRSSRSRSRSGSHHSSHSHTRRVYV